MRLNVGFSHAERLVALIGAAFVAYLVLSDIWGPEIAWRFFRLALLIAAVWTMAALILDGWERWVHRRELRKRSLAKLDKRIKSLDYLTLESGGSFFRLDVQSGEVRVDHRPVSPGSVTYNGIPQGGSEPPAEPVLPVIARAECVLLWGGRGAGKTNLARWAMREQAKAGAGVVVVDPKPPAPAKWPGCRIVGADHDYDGAAAALDHLTRNLRTIRGRLTVIIDEVTLLNLRIPDFPSLWLPLLLEGREYGAGVWIIGQSRTAGSLGLAGKYDLLECFDYLVACRKGGDGSRWAEVETAGEPPKTYRQPGVFLAGPSGGGAADGPGRSGPQRPADDPDVYDAAPGDWEDHAEGGAGATLKRKIAGLIGFHRRPEAMTEQRSAIWEALYRSGGPMTAKELEGITGMRGSYIRKTLSRMVQDGLVAKVGRGQYRLPR
jgi:hypothetical protein